MPFQYDKEKDKNKNRNNMIKTGSSSIILGNEYYNGYFPIKKDKLLKITNKNDNHNEFKYLDNIRKIENYKKYYSIPDETIFILNPGDKFYIYLEQITKPYFLNNSNIFNIFTNNLYCSYIDNAGDKDLLETIEDLDNNLDFSVWNSYNSILKFIKQIMYGINYLHKNKICHLDIKPENIIVNTKTKQYKIIDFGFTSIEPFNDFISNIKGTPGYFPKYFKTEKITPWLPKINTNDMILINNKLPIQHDFKLVYKIDSHCFGRVLHFLKYIYKKNKVYIFFNNEKKKEKLINDIILSLIEKDVYKRLTIEDCIKKYKI